MLKLNMGSLEEEKRVAESEEKRPESLTCPNKRAIKIHIRNHYTHLYEGRQICRVPIRTGRSLAEALGYPLDLLDFVPEDHWARFVPCGNPLRMVHPAQGERILNLGCGAAVDSFALWALYGASVRIVSTDIVFSVLRNNSELARISAGPFHPEIHSSARPKDVLSWVCADGEQLPFQPGAFHWVIMNGVFNLFPDKASLLAEVMRILRPGGRLAGTDLCIDAPLPDYFHEERDAWAWCMSGACMDEELIGLLRNSRFEEIRLDHEEDGDMFHRVAFCCRKSTAEPTNEVAADVIIRNS